MRSLPLYQQIREYLRDKIVSGEYAPHVQILPEEQLAAQFGVSRMTANKAISGLVQEGYLERRAGAGTFVTDLKSESTLIEVRNIADEVRARQHTYSNRVIVRETLPASSSVALQLELKPGVRVFHTLLVHYENGTPIQLEDRYVNPHQVPHYLETDFSVHTPNEVLEQAHPVSGLEHTVEAVLPVADEAALLQIEIDMPCLCMTRRTWSKGDLITCARLLFPGNRYKLRAVA